MMSPESTEGHHFVMGCGLARFWCGAVIRSIQCGEEQIV